MLIKKYKKIGAGKYKVYIDNQEIILLEDVILKYKLLLKKEIDNDLYNQIIIDNNKEKGYQKCLKYLTIKKRSKKELLGYFKKNEIEFDCYESFLKRFEKLGLINDEEYAKSYINDKIFLSKKSPYKIKRELLENNIDERLIDSILLTYSDEIEKSLKKLVEKKIKLNNKYSSKIMKQKILNDYITMGYSKELIVKVLNKCNIYQSEENIFKKEYEKQYKKLSKKYSEQDLLKQLKESFYKKGFSINLINEYINK